MKLLRVTTVPMSLRYLLRGQPRWMNKQGVEVHLASADGNEIADVIDFEGVIHHTIPMTRAITPFRDIKAIWVMYRLIKAERFDIVHSHTPKAGFVTMIAAWLAGVKIRLHTVAGLPLIGKTGLRRFLLTIIEKWTYRFATGVYSNSPNLMEFLITELRVDEQKVKVLGKGSSNGIDSNYFSRKEINEQTVAAKKNELGLTGNEFVFLFVGRMVRDKGIEELVQSFMEVSEKNPDVRLLLIGPMEQHLDPISLEGTNEIKLNPNIIFLGYQQDVRIFYAISDVLVFPSYREGFPNVPLQAGAMGLPVIATNINGCNEIITDRENGLLVKKKSVEELTNAMNLLYEDLPLRNMLSDRSRGLVVERFDQQTLWEEIIKEYRSLLKYV